MPKLKVCKEYKFGEVTAYQIVEDFQKRFCFECRWFELSFGTPDFSEYTPGEPAEMVCYKGKFSSYKYDMDMHLFRKWIRKARDCEHFEFVE